MNMNTTEAVNASLILLRENTSQQSKDRDEGGLYMVSWIVFGGAAFAFCVALLIVICVPRYTCLQKRARKSEIRTKTITVYKEGDTNINLFSDSLRVYTPNVLHRSSSKSLINVNRRGPYGESDEECDTPFLDIAGSDKDSSNGVDSALDNYNADIGYPNNTLCNGIYPPNPNSEMPSSIVTEQCNNSFCDSVSFNESSWILNDQLVHATERFGDGCSDSVGHNVFPYEEHIEYVKLVKSPAGKDDADPEETCPKTLVQPKIKDIDYNLLNWNSVFMFLAQRIEPSKWKLFFINLYGNIPCQGNVNISVKVDQVEQDAKQRMGNIDTVSHLLEQFKAWKQFAGRNAKHTMICDALKELNWNDTLEEFRTYMRTPPLLSSDCDHLQKVFNNCSPTLDNSFEGSVPSDIPLPLSSNTAIDIAANDRKNIHLSRAFQSRGKVSYRCEMSYEVDNRQPHNESVNQERNDPDGVPTSLCNRFIEDGVDCGVNIEKSELPTANRTKQDIEVKEIIDKACSSNIQKKSKLLSGNIKGKGINFHPKRTRKKSRKYRRAKKITCSRTKLSKDSFHMLLSTFLESAKVNLKRDMYDIFLQHTISKVIKETHVSEKVILSLTYEEYRDVDESKTKRETIFIMYSENTRLTLGESTFEELRCYTENARQQVINRLATTIDQESQKYLFIDFDGNRIHSKEAKIDTADDTNSDDSSYITIEEDSAMSED